MKEIMEKPNFEEMTMTDLEAMAYRLSEERDSVNAKLSQAKEEIKRRRSVKVNPDTETTVDGEGVTHKTHGKKEDQ